MFNSNELEGGPCKIDHSDGALPVAQQLWPYVSKAISRATEMMDPLLKLFGVTDENKSPFCREFTSGDDLMEEYIAYCPRTFSYNGVSGASDVDDEVEVVEVRDTTQDVAARIKRFATDLTKLTGVDCSDDSGDDDEVQLVESADKGNDDTEVEIVDNTMSGMSKAAKRKAERRVATAAEKNQRADKLMIAVTSAMKCDKMEDFVECIMTASAAVEAVDRKSERGPGLRTANSLIGRWFKGQRRTLLKDRWIMRMV